MNAVLWIVATLVTEWALKTIWREVVRRSHAKAAADRQDEAEELAWSDAMRVPLTSAMPITVPALSTVWTAQDRLDGIARRIAKLEQ
jgi:hypothetical protein